MAEEIKKHYYDKDLPLAERKQLFATAMDKMMNPVPAGSFDPNTFEPAGADATEVSDRVREVPPTLLPTFGMKPKTVREGQMIGMYESKQDIYLILAHRCNALQAEIDLLKTKIK
jgi:hypothetical protein